MKINASEYTAKVDLLGWAKRPRSQMALQMVIDLAVKEEDDRFIEILHGLKEAGHVSGDQLIRKWDHSVERWVKFQQ